MRSLRLFQESKRLTHGRKKGLYSTQKELARTKSNLVYNMISGMQNEPVGTEKNDEKEAAGKKPGANRK